MKASSATSAASLARRLKISPATVSLILNGRDAQYKVSPATRAKVLRMAAQLDYRHPRRVRSRRMAVVVAPELMASWQAGSSWQILGSFMRELEAGGWWIRQSLGALEELEVDSPLLMEADVVLLPVRHETKERVVEIAQELSRRKVLTVLMGGMLSGAKAIHVDGDHDAVGRLAADYLLDRLKGRVATVVGAAGNPHAEDRLRGFLNRCLERGRPVAEEMIWRGGNFSIPEAHRLVLEKWKTKGPKPQGIFFQSDLMAAAGILALRSIGEWNADGVRILGVDMDPISREMGFPTIGFQSEAAGVRLARLVMDAVKNGDGCEGVNFLFPPKIVEPFVEKHET